MNTDDFFNRHKEAFLREAHLHLDNMNSALIKLEKNPQDKKLLHAIFQAAHTLKSISATLGLNKIAQLCHGIEDLLAASRDGVIVLVQHANLLFECFDLLSENLKSISLGQGELSTEALVSQVRALMNAGETISSNTLPSEQKILLSATEKIQSIEVKVDRLDTLMKLSEELLVSRMKLDLFRESINSPELTAVTDTLGRIITELQYNIMQVRLVPIRFIFDRFPRMVRDLAKKQQKEIELITEGGDIELDRSLIDEVAESLAHLIRNAVDHGLETVKVRKVLGKNPQGTIELKAQRLKEFVFIEVSDDGAGLNIAEIKKIALKQKLIDVNAQPEEIVNAIFKGVSTSETITDVSGRGLGLSIVKQKIESIGGTIRVESQPNNGVHFFIKLPLTLAVIKVLFVKVSMQTYAIPLNNIERLLIVPHEDFKGILNYDAVLHENIDIPLTHLSMLFGVQETQLERYPIVVIHHEGERLGLVVDMLLSTQDVVIKPLGKVVHENRFFSGSALIGSGEMVLILDIDNLFLSRRRNEGRPENAI